METSDQCNKWRESEDMKWFLESPSHHLRMKEIANLVEGEFILDVGCSVGLVASLVQKKGEFVVGIDLDKRKLNVAHKMNRELELIVCSSLNLPFKERVFDSVILGEIIEHVENPYKLLRTSNRVLKQNGILVLTTPNGLRISQIIRALSRKTIPLWGQHFYEFTPSTISSMVKRTGFNIEAMCGIGFLILFPPKRLMKFLVLLSKCFQFFFPFLLTNLIIKAKKA